MKKHEFFVMMHFAAAFFVVSLLLVSCKKEPKAAVIIAKKPAKAVKKGVERVEDFDASRQVEWCGSTYTVTTRRTADTSLPLVVDEMGRQYYDNAITLTVKRSDGSTFFSRRFVKKDFAGCVSSGAGKGALLGIVFDYAKGGALYFAASVGSPDRLSDEYVPLVVAIDRSGGVSISLADFDF